MGRAIVLAATMVLATGAGALDGFPPKVARRLETVLAGPPGAVTLDADGTLWATDVGETFYRWLVRTGRLPRMEPGRDYWAEYKRLEATDQNAAYGLLVTSMAGLEESLVMRWCRHHARTHVRPRIYAAWRGLVAAFRERGFEVYVVSGSNAWSVRAAANDLGIDAGHVLAIEVAVEGGLLTDRLVGPLTWAQGKVDAIVDRIGRRPVFAAGDSTGDIAMLSLATREALVVEARHRPAAPALDREARLKGWLRVTFDR